MVFVLEIVQIITEIFQRKYLQKCYPLKYGGRSKIFPAENFRFHHFVYYYILGYKYPLSKFKKYVSLSGDYYKISG